MRIALLADIHGNLLALDAILNHIQRQGGVDAYWILGDLSALGYDPAGVLERLTSLPNAVFIRGNTDRYMTTGDRPTPTLEQAQQNPALIATYGEVAASFAWTQGYLEARDWLDWLQTLPLEVRLELPNGTRVLLVHCAPGTDDGVGLHSTLSDDELRLKLTGCAEDLICVGHFHIAIQRHLDSKCIINPGSVSNCFAPDWRAAYAILSADSQGYQMQYYRVEYDWQAAIAATQRSSNPGAGYIVKLLEGKIRTPWFDEWDGRLHYPPIQPE